MNPGYLFRRPDMGLIGLQNKQFPADKKILKGNKVLKKPT